MKCSSCKKLLEDYISGRLAGDVKQDVKTHLEQCKQCRSEFAVLTMLNSSIAMEKSIRPNAFIEAKIMGQIIGESRHNNLMKTGRTLRPVWQNVSIAASISIAILLGILAGNKATTNLSYNTPEELVYLDDAEMESINSLGLFSVSSEQ